MVIDNIEIELADIKLTRPYTIAYKTTSSIKNIFIYYYITILLYFYITILIY